MLHAPFRRAVAIAATSRLILSGTFAFVLLLCGAAWFPANAFVAYVSADDFFVLGAHSRRGLRGPDGAIVELRDTTCKIVGIANGGMFAASGYGHGLREAGNSPPSR